MSGIEIKKIGITRRNKVTVPMYLQIVFAVLDDRILELGEQVLRELQKGNGKQRL